jgi:putative sigma-54 modulation protein
MNIDIQSLGFPITPALANHARRRLQFGLTRHSVRIRRIVVRLGDQNGPRGGEDKFCRIRVYLFDAPMAVVVEIGADLYAVIDRTADRVGRAVVKHLDRSRDTGRRARSNGSRAPVEPLDAPSRPGRTEGDRP